MARIRPRTNERRASQGNGPGDVPGPFWSGLERFSDEAANQGRKAFTRLEHVFQPGQNIRREGDGYALGFLFGGLGGHGHGAGPPRC